MKTMIIDDDETTLRVLEATVEQLGHEVVIRQQAMGTINEITRQRPDVVVLDVGLPGLSGDRLAALLVESHPGLTLILHSSLPIEELRRRARQCGATGYIEKTGDLAEFSEQFRRFVARRAADPRPNQSAGRADGRK